ncbi:malonyl-CoA decarboxylase [Pseudomonadota bacterium]
MSDTEKTGILDRTLIGLRSAWRDVVQPGRGLEPTEFRPDLPESDAEKLRKHMQECLDGKGGEVSARARAATLGQVYLYLNDTGRKRFLEIMVRDFCLDRESLYSAARNIGEHDDLETSMRAETELRNILRPPHLKLLTQFNALPQGVKFLVDLRADLRTYMDGDPLLEGLDRDLKALLISWFDIGFLDLKRITWNEPASLLEKLVDYEAVHQITSWEDLKNRLDSDRRVYAFFHPRMPMEPLIFVQVALVSGISDNIHDLLDENAPNQDPRGADTAIFYSITNTQRGLHGVSFGNFLIKRVVDHLSRDLPNLKTFATLSPVPGLRKFIGKLTSEQEQAILSEYEIGEIQRLTEVEHLKDVIKNFDWDHDVKLAEVIRRPLINICARYLILEQKDGHALDPVAHFHLNNGARLERINWLADVSKKGMQQSAGLMVNYLYKLSDIDKNHERYQASGKVVTSSSLRSLVKDQESLVKAQN